MLPHLLRTTTLSVYCSNTCAGYQNIKKEFKDMTENSPSLSTLRILRKLQPFYNFFSSYMSSFKGRSETKARAKRQKLEQKYDR